jgi:uncharacterized RDD family membrane protein YckC
MNYGGFWIRFLAYIVDSLIVFIAFFAIVMLVTVMGLELAGTQLILFVMGVLYYALMQSSKRQATFGKALLGLKVGGPDGERIGLGRALAREVAKILSTLTLLIGFIIAAFTKRKQALHDLIATTVVVRAEPGHVVAGLAIAVLALVAPFIVAFMFGAAVFTAALGDFAGSMMSGTDIAMQPPQKPAAPAPGAKPAAPAAAKPAAPASTADAKPAGPTADAKPAAPAVEAKPAAAPAPAPTVIAQAQPAKPAGAPAESPKPRAAEPAKPMAAEPVKPMAAEPEKPKMAERTVEKAPEPARKAEVAEAPKAADAPMRTAAPAPQVASVPGPRFNDLATAVLYRDPETVEVLLGYGKWPDKPDSRGVTPLMLAASLGDARSAEALLKAGANPNRPGPGGETAVIIARERRDTAMLGLMQRYGGR